MIEIGSTDFYFSKPTLSSADLEMYSIQLFDQWEESVSKALHLPDYALHLQINEGSILGKGNIYTKLGALYIGIGVYGSFVAGLQTIHTQVRDASQTLVNAASSMLELDNEPPVVRKRGAVLGSLKNLFIKVQNGTMTAEHAVYEAERLLRDHEHESPELVEELKRELSNAPLFHQQYHLPLEDEEEPPIDKPLKDPSHNRRAPPPQVPVYQLRIDVWRDSKNEEKTVKVLPIKKNMRVEKITRKFGP